jgi:hypothetical protein
MAKIGAVHSIIVNGKTVARIKPEDLGKEITEPNGGSFEYYYRRGEKHFFRSPFGKIAVTGLTKEESAKIERGKVYTMKWGYVHDLYEREESATIINSSK